MSYIHGEDLIKQYGNGDAAVMAVGGMSFSIQMGEFVAVMGESGSGKSTLLSVMGGVLGGIMKQGISIGTGSKG